MFVAFVQIPWGGQKRKLEAVLDRALELTKICRDVKGLKRKEFMNNGASGGGIYVCEARENAHAPFDDGWADWMEGRLGVRSTLTTNYNRATLGIRAFKVRVNGEAGTPPWLTDVSE